MTDPANPAPRIAPYGYNAKGEPVYTWNLSSTQLADAVQCPLPPQAVLPVIFVPGIMGSNLKSIPQPPSTESAPVWRLDAGAFDKNTPLLKLWGSKSAGTRQKKLHPQRVAVDNQGAVPTRSFGSVRPARTLAGQDGSHMLAKLYRARGWGEVGETSYHGFLLQLEDALNSGDQPEKWPHFLIHPEQLEVIKATPGPVQEAFLKRGLTIDMPMLRELVKKEGLPPLMSDDLLVRSLYRMPVHACGYNWLASNKEAADALAVRIHEVINQYGDDCKQVILVTHSMGGLVARCCAALPGMSDKIAGIVHGVMPAAGAPVAYRRCKLGMREESKLAGLVIGSTGKEISAVFAQAPGALQLLPTQQYRPGWLRLRNEQGALATPPWPVKDPYNEIYLRRDRWWGLMREEWLSPPNGTPITWDDFASNIRLARDFHKELGQFYAAMTYVYYGADAGQPSFETITWDMRKGKGRNVSGPNGTPPNALQVSAMGMHEVRDDGTNPIYVGGESVFLPNYSPGVTAAVETSHWELHCRMQDAIGDGTVPELSGRAPLQQAGAGKVRYQFRLPGFDHEKSYLDLRVQSVTLYCLIKIAAQATRPACIAR